MQEIERPKCTSNQFCSQLCTRKNCLVPAMMCAKQTFLKQRCQCHKVHYESRCSYRKFEDVYAHVNNNKKPLQGEVEKMLDSIQEKIYQTINILNEQNLKFRLWRQKLGYTRLAKEFVEKLQNKRYSQINGDFIYKLYKELSYNEKLKNKNMINLSINMINASESLDKLVKNIRQMYHSLQNPEEDNPFVLKVQNIDNTSEYKQKVRQIETNRISVNKVREIEQPLQLRWSKEFRANTIKILGNIVIQQVQQVTSTQYENTFILLQPPLKHLQKFRIKLLKNNHEIYVGICLKSKVEKEKYGFSKFSTIKHGVYLFGTEGNTYSNHQPSMNNKITTSNIQLKQNDIIEVTLDLSRAVVIFHLNNVEILQLTIKRRRQNHEPYYGCVYLDEKGESVELLPSKQKDIFQIKRQEAVN